MEAPLAIVRASNRRLEQLQAEESLRLVTRVAVGTGSVEKDDSRRITDDWKKAAYPHYRRVAKVKSARDLAAIGIGVRHVKREKGDRG